MARVDRGSIVESLGRLFATGTATALGEAELLERFVSQGDPRAFEVILQRHGPTVLRVCQRVLDDPNDVDDAFQATFLILVKKAASIREREVLGTWLYGVARRVAVRARVNGRLSRACVCHRGGGAGASTHRRRLCRPGTPEVQTGKPAIGTRSSRPSFQKPTWRMS
jgi:hypothetical protein